MNKSAEGCETNPTYIAVKKAKHLEDSETTPKSCLDAVFKLLETSSQTSSQNSLSELVRLLQSQVLARQAVKVLPAVAQPVSFTPHHTPWKI